MRKERGRRGDQWVNGSVVTREEVPERHCFRVFVFLSKCTHCPFIGFIVSLSLSLSSFELGGRGSGSVGDNKRVGNHAVLVMLRVGVVDIRINVIFGHIVVLCCNKYPACQQHKCSRDEDCDYIV